MIKRFWKGTDEDGEIAIQALKDSMPSKRQTEYNQRDLKKRAMNSELTKIAELGGSFGCDLLEDSLGEKYVRKFGASSEHIRNEFEANKIYRSLGVPVPDHSLHLTTQGKPYMLTKYLKGAINLGAYMRFSLPEEKANVLEQIRNRMAVIALMADWDAIGMDQDNMLVSKCGEVIQVDSGGALHYRALGEPKGKLFGPEVSELSSLRDPSRSASEWFGDLTDSEVRKQIAEIDADKIIGKNKTKGILLSRLSMMREF